MKKLWSGVLLALMVVGPCLSAQQAKFDVPQRSDQERWNRAAWYFVLFPAVMLAFGKAKGMTIEETADWLGKLFAPGWSSNMTPQGFVLAVHRNLMVNPTAIVEVVSAADNEMTFRSNRYYLPYFGEKGVMYGITVAEFEKSMIVMNKVIAEHCGLQIEEKVDGMWWVTTVSKKK